MAKAHLQMLGILTRYQQRLLKDLRTPATITTNWGEANWTNASYEHDIYVLPLQHTLEHTPAVHATQLPLLTL